MPNLSLDIGSWPTVNCDNVPEPVVVRSPTLSIESDNGPRAKRRRLTHRKMPSVDQPVADQPTKVGLADLPATGEPNSASDDDKVSPRFIKMVNSYKSSIDAGSIIGDEAKQRKSSIISISDDGEADMQTDEDLGTEELSLVDDEEQSQEDMPVEDMSAEDRAVL